MSTLYRKYRPQNFSEIFSQNHIKLTLEHEIEKSQISHAYLFCGPRGIGKTTLARVFSKAVNCMNRQDGEYEPCNECRSCQEINNGSDMDIVEIDAASHTGVDNVRENIIASSRLLPLISKYKIFIIDEVHMLSISAFNSLLKILEEPPKHIIFILCTTETHKVPATIISRCQRFDFKKLAIAEVAKKLAFIAQKENLKVDNKIFDMIARASEGHMRDAESIFGQIAAIGGEKITMEDALLVIPASSIGDAVKLIKAISNKDVPGAILVINKLVDEGVNLKNFTKDLIEIMRKILFAKISANLSDKLADEYGEDIEKELSAIIQTLSMPMIIKYIDEFTLARSSIKDSYILQLPLEIAVVKLTLSPEKILNYPGPLPQQKNQVAAATDNNEIKPNFVSTSDHAAHLDISGVLNRWNEFLAKIKQQNHSLSFILKVCQPKNISNNLLCLAFKYKFHKDRLDEVKIKTLVENVLKETYGTNMQVEAVLDETLELSNGDMRISETPADNYQPEPATEPESGEKNLLDNLLKTFGGKVVG